MDSTAVAVVGLLLLAVAVSALADRFRLPAPVLLVLAGIAIGELPGVGSVDVDPSLVSLVVLPPLLYAAALDVPTRELRRDAGQITGLAVGLVAFTTLAVALVAHAAFTGMSLAVALLLGALLSSVDPVAVSALARRMHLPRRLLTVVQSESLLNDATSLVAYRVAVAVVVAGGGTTVAAVLGRLALLAGGGVAVGLGTGWLAVLVRRRVHEVDAGNALAFVTPFGAYLLAEELSSSGVTAVVVCGLFVGPRMPRLASSTARLREQGVFSVVVFALEGLVFALIGLELPALLRALPSGSSILGPTLLVLVTVVVTRVVWVYPAVYLPRLIGRSTTTGWQVPALLSWVGTRGVVALTAALSVPLTTRSGAPFPFRAELLLITIVVIVATLVAQGLTLAPLASRLGVAGDPDEDAREQTLARHQAAKVALAHLEELLDAGEAHPEAVERLRRGLEQRVDRTRQRLDGAPLAGSGESYRRLRLDLLDVERREVLRLRDSGEVSERVVAEVLRSFDLEAAALD